MFCQRNGLNEVWREEGDEARTAKTKSFWSSSLERTYIRLSKPSQNMVSSSQLPICSIQPLPEASLLERTHIRSSEPLPEACPLEPLSQFTRPFLTQTSSLERTYIRSSEPSQNAIRSNNPPVRLSELYIIPGLFLNMIKKGVLRSSKVGLEPQFDIEE